MKRMSSSTVESSSNRNSWLKEEFDEEGGSTVSRGEQKKRSKKLKDHFKTIKQKNKRKFTRIMGSGKKPEPISNVYPDSEENINRSSANDLLNIFNGMFNLYNVKRNKDNVVNLRELVRLLNY